MVKYVLSPRNMLITARLVAKSLSLSVSTVPKQFPPVIRWGHVGGYYDEDTLYNSRSGILGTRRPVLSRTLHEAGIPAIEYENSGIPDKYPVVIRTMTNSFGGRGIVIAENEAEFLEVFDPSHHLWAPWYRFRFELGVHFFDPEIIRVFKKIPHTNSRFNILNSDRCHFSLRDVSHYKKLPAFVESVVNSVQVKFGRADIGFDDDYGTYRLIEINTAPGLTNSNTLREYVQRLENVI